MREDSRYGESNEDWRQILMGTHPSLVRQRQIFRHLPSDPRCKVCLAPYAGLGGPLVKAFGFGRYPRNPQICNSCYRQSMAHPGGAVLEISALFADVRGSTGLAEQVGPAEFQRQVEGYYRVATRAVRESGGIVDRLLGDGVMALFIPAFVVGGAHAAAAVDAARSILAEVSLPVGAGVHSGEAWVGFTGGDTNDIVEFTALGDAVNSASRLGSEAGSGELLVSAPSATAAGLDTGALEQRHLQLRGREAPLDAWSEHIKAEASA